MKYSIINSSGVVTGTGSTDGGGGSGKSNIGPFTFWTPSSDMPTSYTNMTYPIGNWSGSGQAVMNAGQKMGSAGTITSLSALINNATNGIQVNFQVYKNGVATGLLVSGVGASGTTTALQQSASTPIAFAAGDNLSVYISGNGSNINQSFDAFIEVTLT